jgi:hypothetical protein
MATLVLLCFAVPTHPHQAENKSCEYWIKNKDYIDTYYRLLYKGCKGI